MATEIYLKRHSQAEDDQAISATELAFAVLSINHDHRHNLPKLQTADAEEWAQLAELLEAQVDTKSAVYVGRFAVTSAEFASAYDTAKQMHATQQKSESSYQQAVESVLPNTAMTLGEKIRHDFPDDAITQSLVLECIKSQADSLQNCEANAQSNVQAGM
jgi:sugar diacid utilization regulator